MGAQGSERVLSLSSHDERAAVEIPREEAEGSGPSSANSSDSLSGQGPATPLEHFNHGDFEEEKKDLNRQEGPPD